MLTATEGIGDNGARVDALVFLAKRVPEPLLERVLTAAEGIKDDGGRTRALASLAQRLPEPLLERALTAAEGIKDDWAGRMRWHLWRSACRSRFGQRCWSER